MNGLHLGKPIHRAVLPLGPDAFCSAPQDTAAWQAAHPAEQHWMAYVEGRLRARAHLSPATSIGSTPIPTGLRSSLQASTTVYQHPQRCLLSSVTGASPLRRRHRIVEYHGGCYWHDGCGDCHARNKEHLLALVNQGDCADRLTR